MNPLSDKPKIMIVEDDDQAAGRMESLLNLNGYSVSAIEATGGAPDRARADRPDLVLMKFAKGAVWTTLETAATIRFKLEIPLLFVLEHCEPDQRESIRLALPGPCIFEPFRNADLKRAMDGALEAGNLTGGVHYSSTIRETRLEIADRDHLAGALRASEDRLQTLTDNLPDIVYALGPDGTVLDINVHALIQYGYQASDILGKMFLEVIHPDDRDRILTSYFDAIANRRELTRGLEFRIVDKDGGEHLVELHSRIQFDGQGLIIREDGILRDVTSRREAEEALKGAYEEMEKLVRGRTFELFQANEDLRAALDERMAAEETLRKSEEKFRAVADFTYDWEYWIGPNRQIVYMSPACERVSGYSADDFMADPGLMDRIVHPDDRDLHHRHMRDYRNGPLNYAERDGFEFRIIPKDGGERWIAHRCRPVFGKDGIFLGRRVNHQDVTDRREADEEKEKLAAQLRQAHKMEAIGTLAGGIAHDFNNILGAIIGHTQLAQMILRQDHPIRESLDMVLSAAQRAAQLVRQILNFSRRIESQFISFELAPLVKETLKLLRSSLPTTIDLQPMIAEEPMVVRGDPSQIQQVLINLATNSSQAMQDTGGRVEVILSRAASGPSQAQKHPNLPEGSCCRLVVRDTGPGMDTETLRRVFEPFFTTKPVGEGTGLGLSVVYGIVRNHQGAIHAESQVGEGSMFEVFLPLAEMEVDRTAPARPLAVYAGQERILFVDDEPSLVEFGREALENLGYQVTALTSSREALRIFNENPDRFDLVITDKTMPVLTGPEMAREMIARRADIPIILCTGFSEGPAPERSADAEIRRLVLKPYEIAELGATVREVLGR